MSLTLYAHPFSSYSQKVLIALWEKEVSFTYRHLEQPCAAEERAALWPLGRFPVLVDHGCVIAESSIIIEHLDLHYAGPVRLLPEDRVAALEVRFMDRFFDNFVMAEMQKPVLEAIRPDGGRKDEAMSSLRGARNGVYLAGKTADGAELGRGRKLFPSRLRGGAVAVLCRLGSPDRARLSKFAGVPVAPVGAAVLCARCRRGAALSRLFSAWRARSGLSGDLQKNQAKQDRVFGDAADIMPDDRCDNAARCLQPVRAAGAISHSTTIEDASGRRKAGHRITSTLRINEAPLDAFEHLLMLASVILALAIGDITISLNRLLQAGRLVRWDWLAPLAAMVVFLKIITQWWSWFGAERAASGITFGMYIGVLAGAVLLFLLAATALSAGIDEAGVNLRDHYARVHRRFWLLFAAHWIVATGVAIWIESTVEDAKFDDLSPVYLIVPVAVVLAFWRNRWVHLVCLLGFLLLYLGHTFGHTLNP